ncbi:uncharacterized protein N7473_012996 [Penicillium subrubescens]|uniref:uncharacterized protein n=1 Tax=Penicillium subrubescens TaxID=1316194 RepID=UPI002545B464|nr:uncharacterized protein N7473_012996 [Penicillium subrubescens]KAJ5875649.1 hypothetical protein N7473_012996 [Penicillium subrubescens]
MTGRRRVTVSSPDNHRPLDYWEDENHWREENTPFRGNDWLLQDSLKIGGNANTPGPWRQNSSRAGLVLAPGAARVHDPGRMQCEDEQI